MSADHGDRAWICSVIFVASLLVVVVALMLLDSPHETPDPGQPAPALHP